MAEQDTVRLLRECDSGAKMGVDSLTGVLDRVKNDGLRDMLARSRQDHERLSRDVQQRLDQLGDYGKEPPVMASAMSWLKTNMELLSDSSDAKIADLMTDGCNMGVKSLSKYLNQYQAADEASKSLAQKLIGLEEKLARKIRPYL